jgi:bacterial/archaeal transporter family protein
MWWIYALLSALFASFTAILAKQGVENMNSDLATAIRTVVVLIITWVVVFAKGGMDSFSSLSTRNLLFLIASGAATGLSWLFYFRAIQLGNVSQVAPVDKLSVALTVLLAAFLLGEAMSMKTIPGAGLIIAGTIVIIK